MSHNQVIKCLRVGDRVLCRQRRASRSGKVLAILGDGREIEVEWWRMNGTFGFLVTSSVVKADRIIKKLASAA